MSKTFICLIIFLLIPSLLLAWNLVSVIGVVEEAGNYFGDASDGDVTISTDTNLSATQDGDMVVMNYSSLTINTGVTLTTNNRCKGLLIYVTGNATINGTLTMNARGANVDPVVAGVSSTGLRLPMLKSGSIDTLAAADFAGCGSAAIAAVANQGAISGDGKIYTIARGGAAGGASVVSSNGNDGSNGTTGESGGGGSGGSYSAASGAGAAGTCFTGGSGGGGGSESGTATDGGDYGGAGGDGSYYEGAGGSGNPGGAGYAGTGPDGNNGTGGLLILIVGGNLTIGGSGVISANGVDGPLNPVRWGAGGATGGGNVLVLYAGTLSNSGSITATGGTAGTGWGGELSGAGGNGSVQTAQIDPII